jgi:hypothetical protein
LARAQLLVKRGMRAEATPTLQRLAREGGSEVIRSQATSVLQSMSPQWVERMISNRVTFDRSHEPAWTTNEHDQEVSAHWDFLSNYSP